MCGTHVRVVVGGVWNVKLIGREWKSPFWEQGFCRQREVGFGIACETWEMGVMYYRGSQQRKFE